MPKKKKRDNAYYEQLLKTRNPAIYADFHAGKYTSLNLALHAAGIKKKRTPLHELKNAWSKATPPEQADFLRTIGMGVGAGVVPRPTARGSAARPIAVDRRLEPWAKARIETIMTKRGMENGDVMDELGMLRNNTSLKMALRSGTRLQPNMITALEAWLTKNAGV